MQSHHNPQAVLSSSGIWNEESLPVLEWEDPLNRIILPADLQHVMAVAEPVLRWARSKREEALIHHHRDRDVILNVGSYLAAWRYVGKERRGDDVWRVLIEDAGRWYATTVGRDVSGSLNLVAIFGSRRRSFLKNRLEGLDSIVMRER